MSTAANIATKDQAPPLPSDAPVRDWVGALANGSCSNVEFLRHFREQVQEDAESVWEALALLDQNFRTRRIERDIYLPIKAYLERFAVAHGDRADSQPQKVVTVAKQPAAAAVVSPASAAPLRVGAKLRGRYRIIGILGSGSAGMVAEAIDELRADVPGISQRIAIRIRDTREFDQAGQLAAYLRHVCKIQAFSHPNLTRIFDFDQDQGRLLLTMELLAGSTVSQLATDAGAAQSYVLDRHHIIQCVASALHYAHGLGVAHGALRADDVFITHSGGVRVLGLERFFGDTEAGMVRDYLGFASFAHDLLSVVPDADLLQRPEGLTDGQWQSLSAVLGGNEGEGPNLLQRFLAPSSAPSPTPVSTTTEVAATSSGDKTSVLRGALWGSLTMLVLLGAGYLTYDLTQRQPETKPAVASPRGAQVTPTVSRRGVKSRIAAPVASAAAPAVTPSQPSDLQPVSVIAPMTTATATPVAARAVTIDLQREAIEVNDRQTVARITVQRRRSFSKAVTFVWWTETGTAQPGVDFYAVAPRSAEIPAGASSIELFVPLVPNAENKQPRTFYVKIDEAGAGAELGDRTLAQVSIAPPGYVAPPEVDVAATTGAPAPSEPSAAESK